MIVINFCGFSLTSDSELTVNELEAGLLENLKPLSTSFLEIENEYDINSALFASIVALESGWGTSDLSLYQNNITSVVSSESENGYETYRTKEECLWETARLFNEEYLDENGMYYQDTDNLSTILSFYYLGKSKDELNETELEKLNHYVDTVYDIYYGIIDRAKT